jgi:hypothetical protein
LQGIYEKSGLKNRLSDLSLNQTKLIFCEELDFYHNLSQNWRQIRRIQNSVKDFDAKTVSCKPKIVQGASFRCLPDYAQVLLPDGSQISISQIKPTHKVLSYNPSNSIVESKKVVRVFKKLLGARRIFRVTHQFGFLECTEDHRIYTTNAGYVRACCLSGQHKVVYLPFLKEGFDFIDATKSLKASKCTRKIRTFKEEPNMFVYDIEVEDNHNFFVERLLVRN